MSLKTLSICICISLGTSSIHAGTSTSSKIFSPCPDSPNCVSSLTEDIKHFVQPITYDGTVDNARQRLIFILENTQRVRIVKSDLNYLHAEYRSFLFRFVDDVQFFLPPDESVIHIKSASRSGYYDFGTNRRRVELLRAAFKSLAQEASSGIGDDE